MTGVKETKIHSNQYYQFLEKNRNLSRFLAPSGELIVIEKLDGRLALAIEISDTTKSIDIKNWIPAILLWKQKLIEWQSIAADNTDIQLCEKLYQLHQRGLSYGQIAKIINLDLELKIRHYLEFALEVEKNQDELKTEFDFSCWMVTHWIERSGNPEDQRMQIEKLHGLELAIFELIAFGISLDQSISIVEENFNTLESGESSFEDEYPINHDHIRNILRNYMYLLEKLPGIPLCKLVKHKIPRKNKETLDTLFPISMTKTIEDTHKPWSKSQVWEPFDNFRGKN